MNQPTQGKTSRPQHPSEETLVGFTKNLLAPDDTLIVKQHVSRCKRCQSALDEIRMEDSFQDEPEIIATLKLDAISAPVQPEGLPDKGTKKPPAKQTVLVPEELRNHAQYRVLSLIGKGGMGNVFLVEHKLTARKEVLKVIHSHLLSREDVRVRFQREIQSAAKLNHPNVVQTLSAIEEGGMIGLVMEYIKGESLSSMVNRVGPLSLARARDFTKQIALGLEHAHKQNMVHRDIKPQNVLASKDGDEFRVRILDFGLAKTTGLAASCSELTMDGAIIGTPNYMAPEQAINPSLADTRSDIYSLGCTWFFLLTGRSPFEADSPLAIMNAHQNNPPPLIRSIRKEVPEETEQILSRMMAKNPDDRFQSPTELIEALASSRAVPSVEQVTTLFRNQAVNSGSPIDLSVFSERSTSQRKAKKKKKGKFNSLIQVVLISIPSIALVGILMLRPHWITKLRSLLQTIDVQNREAVPPGQASIELAQIPAGVQVFIDDFPAKFERPRADAKPCILASPGTYQLSARRNDKEIYRVSVHLVANETKVLSLEDSKVPPRSAIVEPPKKDTAPSIAKILANPREPIAEPSTIETAPSDIPNVSASKASLLDEKVVLGKRFVVQQRLVGHNSPILRVLHLNDGKIISAQRDGKPIPLANRSRANGLASATQINLWGKDGTFQSLTNEGTLVDFLAAPNGSSICHIARVFGAGLTVQLYKGVQNQGAQSIWKTELTTLAPSKSEIPYFAFSADSDELMMVTSQGSFTRLNLRTGKVQPPVASLINIDKSTVVSMSASHKLDYALFGLTSGEMLVIGTRDGKQVFPKSEDKQDSSKTLDLPVIATQFNSKDNRIATLHSDGTVQFFEFPTLNRLENLPQSLSGSIRLVGCSVNGRYLAAVDDRMRISVYDLDEGEVFASWVEPTATDRATSISVGNFGKRIAIGFESGSVSMLQSAKE